MNEPDKFAADFETGFNAAFGVEPEAGTGLDLSSIMGIAAQMGEHIADAQRKAEETEIEGSAGSGAVVVVMTGGFALRSVRIDPKVVDPNDVEMLEDLLTAAFRDALGQAESLQAQANPMAGIDLGGLGGLLGGNG